MSITKALTRYRAIVLLAISLLALGAVAGYGALQLRLVISLQLRTDTVAAICTTLRHQQYDALAAMIDPTPVTPVATGAFDAHAFQTQLHTLDLRQGEVSSCAWNALHLDDESATYIYTLHRVHVTTPIAMQVILQREPDNTWRISRSSAFTSHPV